jgi:hypothetical protein
MEDLMEKFAPKNTNEQTTENTNQEQVNQEEVTNTEEVNTENTENVQANTEENNNEETITESDFNLDSFNKAFEREFKTMDEVTDLLNLSKEHPELKAKLDEKDKLIAERDETLKEQYNPMSYFANEKQFKLNQILKANEGLNESIVSRLMNADLEKLSDKDVLKLNDLIKTKGTFDDRIVEMDIEDRYGLNVNKEDLEGDELRTYQIKEYRMKKDADSARDELGKLTDVELPEFKNPLDVNKEDKAEREKIFNESKDKWGEFTNEFLDKFDKLSIPYKDDDKKDAVFEFGIDDNFKQLAKERIPEIATLLGRDATKKEDVQAIVEQVQKDYLWIHKNDIIKTAIQDTVTKMTQETFDKYHNTSQPKRTEAPPTLSNEERHNKEQMDKMANDFKLKKKQ